MGGGNGGVACSSNCLSTYAVVLQALTVDVEQNKTFSRNRASKYLTGVWTPGGPRAQTYRSDAALAGVHMIDIKPGARLVNGGSSILTVTQVYCMVFTMSGIVIHCDRETLNILIGYAGLS